MKKEEMSMKKIYAAIDCRVRAGQLADMVRRSEFLFGAPSWGALRSRIMGAASSISGCLDHDDSTVGRLLVDLDDAAGRLPEWPAGNYDAVRGAISDLLRACDAIQIELIG